MSYVLKIKGICNIYSHFCLQGRNYVKNFEKRTWDKIKLGLPEVNILYSEEKGVELVLPEVCILYSEEKGVELVLPEFNILHSQEKVLPEVNILYSEEKGVELVLT